ncbi:MAG: hypothetical protein JXX28_05060 [Deltaproteobacteria bacterium]|nr:hypothetical protein [Deltaproteobacteria bacterium]
MTCAEQLLAGGEGRGGDWSIATAWYRGVVRGSLDAASVPGVGGGTLVDAAPWGERDGLHEVIPLVSGGWLERVTLEPRDEGLCAAGTVRSVPGLTPSTAEGAWAEVCWVPDPWEPLLRAEGADGLWLHPIGAPRVSPAGMAAGARWYGWSGSLQDTGGALLIDGDTLLLSTTAAAWAWGDEPLQRVSVTSAEGESLALLRGDQELARVPLTEGSWEGEVPASVSGLAVVAAGRAPSLPVAPREDLRMEPLGAGVAHLSPHQASRPLLVRWRSLDGPWQGEALLPPGGGAVQLGEGSYELLVESGPAWVPLRLTVDLAADQTKHLGLTLLPALAHPHHALVALGAPVDRSKRWRGTDSQAITALAGGGVRYAVLAPEDDVAPTLDGAALSAWLGWRTGARLSGDGWSVLAWPWDEAPRRAARGAEDLTGLSPEDGLALAWGGPGRARLTAVDLAWMGAVTLPPWKVHPLPDLLTLDHPARSDWSRWFEWLDAGVDLKPAGPLSWVSVDDSAALIDVEDALLRGPLCATTGPWIDLHPLPSPAREPLGHLVEVEVDGAGLTALALYGEGGERLAGAALEGGPQRLRFVLPPTKYAVAAAWGDEEWTVTRPLWYQTP